MEFGLGFGPGLGLAWVHSSGLVSAAGLARACVHVRAHLAHLTPAPRVIGTEGRGVQQSHLGRAGGGGEEEGGEEKK